MSLKLDKRMLLVLAVFLMLVIIPTSFAEDVNDADAVGVNDDSTVDAVSVSAVDDVKQTTSDNSSSVSVSEVEKTGADDESDVLAVGSSEIEIKPNTATVDDYSQGTSKIVIFLINQGSAVTYSSDLWDCQDNFLLYVNNQDPVDTGIAPSGYCDVSSGSIQVNLNIVPTTYWNSGANSVKLGLSSEDTERMVDVGDTVTLTPMTVNVPGSGPEPEDDSIWVNGSYTGSTSDGKKDTPYKTIQAALSAASAGDTIKIAEGEYILTSAISISKNIALVGVGNVVITRSSGNLFTQNSNFKGTVTFTNLTFKEAKNTNGGSVYDTTNYGTSNLATLNFNECNFISNEGTTLIRSSNNVNIDKCIFIANSPTGSTYSASGIVSNYYYGYTTIKISNSIFIANTIKYNYVVDYGNSPYPSVTFTNNYFGTNEATTNLYNYPQKLTDNGYAILEVSEITDEVNVGDSFNLTLKFKNSDGQDLTNDMATLPLTFVPTLGTVSPTTVDMTKEATTTYSATTEGDESVAVNAFGITWFTIDFHVDESPVGKLFVDASYTGGDSDGSKAKPYTTIKDALDNLGTNSQIVVKKGIYSLDNYAINSDVIINGKEDDVIVTTTTNHMTIASGKTVNLTNLIFKGATTTSIVSSGSLTINDCVFEDNSGTNVISSTEGSVDIAYTVFNNNEVTGKIVNAIAGTVDNNFWGSNDAPNVADALNLNKYVIVNATIPSMREGDELESDVIHDININFVLNDGTELDKSLHDVTVTLSSTLGEVTDSVTIIDNEAVAQYSSNVEGNGQIDVKLGDNTLKTFTFTVIERETGRIFVDASYAGDDSDGSKAKPFKTLTDAINKNNDLGGNQEIIVNEGNYASDDGYYQIKKNVNITGRGNVAIDVKGAMFNGYISVSWGEDYPNVVLNNLIITNSSRQSMFQYVNDITINDCTVANISGGSNLIDSARGNIVISNSVFTDIKFDSNYNLITLNTNSNLISISNSVFNNITIRDGKYILSGSNVNINGNFWGTNDPSSLFPTSVTLGNWVVANIDLAETIVQGQTPTLTVEFKLNNGDALTENLPATVLGLTSLLENTFAPESVTITDNVGTVTYNAVTNGNEVINLTSGSKTIVSIERSIEEGDSPDKIFVDETYTGADADGSKDKPFNNLNDAFNAITQTRNNVVLLEGNYAISGYTLSKDATVRWSKRPVTITATGLVIDADVTFNDLIFNGGNTITVNNGAKLTIANTKFVNNTGGIASAGDLAISESQFINTPSTITATAGSVNIAFTEFVLSNDISIASGVTGNIDNNYWGTVPTNIGDLALNNWIALVITPGEDAVDLNASEKQTFTIAFKNTTDGTTFSDLAKDMPVLEIEINPTIGSADKTSIDLSSSDSFTYTATTEGAETVNLTSEGLTFETLEFDVGTSVAGKIFVNGSYTGAVKDGSRLAPFTDVSSAISAAQSGNEIIIYEGTYTSDSYLSLYYNDLTFTGVGEVILTRTVSSGSYSGGQLFSITGRGTFTFNNIIFANTDASNSYYSYGSGFYIDTSDAPTLNIIDCTFANNIAKKGVIFLTNNYGRGNINIQGTKFINNTASSSYLIEYYGGTGYKLNISNSVFIDNTYNNYVVYNKGFAYATVDLNNNFWGSNELSSDVTVSTTMPTTWVIVNVTIDADAITQGDTATIKVTFNSTDGTTVSELDKAMPDTTFDVGHVLNDVDATVTISNNVAEITYNAVNYGDEVITVKAGENVLATLPFSVEEKDDGTKVFVDASYTGESDGSKAKPFNNLKDALDSAKETGKKLVSVAEGTYEIEDYTIDSDVEIYADKAVTIKATGLAINANVTFNKLIFNNGNAIAVNAGKDLNVYDSTFTNNAGVIESNGNLVINATKFINNTAIDGKGIINALAGSVQISYSEFIESTGGSVIVYEADGVATDVNNNYWADNNATGVSTIAPTTWIKLVPTVGTVYSYQETEITFKFVNNDDSELDVAMPTVEIALTSEIGSIDSVVKMENNAGSVTYFSDVDGTETIKYGADELTFDVSEDETGKLFVAPSDYERDATKPVGSKANPYTTLTSAISGATAGTEIIMLEGTYDTNSYYTINKNNLKITGRGKVVLTSSSDSLYYFMNVGSYSGLTLTNLIFENITVVPDTSSWSTYYRGFIEYSGSYSAQNTLSIFNCTFNNNKAPRGMIYGSSNARLNASGNIFYNNSATYSDYSTQLIRVSGNQFAFNYNILIDNKVAYSSGYIVYGPTGQNADYNFWGSNNAPVAYKDYNQVTVNNWVLVNICIDSNDLSVGDTATVTVKFTDKDGNDLAKSMPKFTFDLDKVLGEIPANVAIENNVAQFTYNAVAQGDEVISLKVGDKEIVNFTFYVDESPEGKIFVDANVNETGDGSKAAPFKTIAEAIAKNSELGGNQTIVLKSGEYELANAEISDDVTISAKDDVVINANGQNALTIKDNAKVTLINVNIQNAKDAIIAGENTKLDIINSTFIGNNGAIVSNGTTTVYRTLFKDNEGTEIKANAGSLDVSYSAFIGNANSIESTIQATANNNFWGANTQPAIDNVNISSWVKVNATLQGAPDIYAEVEYDVNVKFTDNEGNDLTDTLPDVTFDASTTLGTIDSTVLVSENNGVVKFITAEEGAGVIDIGSLDTIEFTAVENPVGKVFVAPSDYERDTTKPVGYKQNPYESVSDAYTNANDGDTIILLEGVYSVNSKITVSKNLEFIGRDATITGSLSAYMFDIGKYTVKFTNLTFENVSSSTYMIYIKGTSSPHGKLIMDNVNLVNNEVTSLIYIGDYSDVTITHSNILNNTCTDHLLGNQYNGQYPSDSTYTVNYCNIVGNTIPSGKLIINDNGNANYNYWGINAESVSELPAISTKTMTRNYWIGAFITSAAPTDLAYGDTYNLTVEFKYRSFSTDWLDLDENMPALAFDVSKELGTVPETITVENNIGQITYIASDVGDEVITVKDVGNVSFHVNKAASSIEIIIDSDSYHVGDDFAIVISNNTVARMTINNVSYDIGADGKVVVDTTALAADEYTVVATIDENAHYLNSTANATFTIVKYASHVEISVDPAHYVGDNFTIAVNNDSAVKVAINGNAYDVVDGKVVVDTTALAADEYIVVATIDENYKYLANSTNATFTIVKYPSSVEISVDSAHYLGDDFAIVISNNTAAEVTINGNAYDIGADGKVIIDTTKLTAGKYTVVATTIENGKYLSNTTNATFTLVSSLSVTVEKINEGEKLNVTINDAIKANGTAKVTIGNAAYYINVVDGFGNDVLDTNLKSGTYDINTEFANHTNTTSVTIGLRELNLGFEISETVTGQNATIKVIVPDDLMGDEIILYFKNTKYTLTRADNFTFETDVLTAGDYAVIAVYFGDEIYGTCVNSTKFTVSKLPTSMEVTSAVINAGEVAKITIKLNESISEKVYVDISGIKKIVTLENGVYELEIPNLNVGTYNISVSYPGNDVYTDCENTTATIVVNYNDAGLKANATDVIVGENVTINVEINSAATGNVKVELGNAVYPVVIENGKGVVIIPNLVADTYTAEVIFEGDSLYAASNVNVTFTVSKKEIPSDINISMDIPEGTTSPEFTINLPADATGNFSVTVDGKDTYTAPLVNGSATVKVPELSVGNHTIVSSYSGDDNYAGFTSDSKTVNIPKASIPGGEDALNLTSPEGSDSPTYSINLPGATGNLTVTVDGKDTYSAPLVNGSASVTVPNLSQGDHNITVTYSGDDKFSSISKNTNYHVPIVKIKENKDVSAVYSAKASYKVLITKDGKAVGAGEKVDITFNGKKTTVKTDKNGYATLKLNTKVKVKTYKVTAEYKGVKVTNKVKITHVIKAANKKVKKSKKVTKVKITLKKVNGKYLKGKKVTIKFKGKKYKVKTNKKGKATWKVKKSMLKKLKVGKKYKYTVTYGKDVVTKKLTIKK